jgi:para-nitrobenzyl esterase
VWAPEGQGPFPVFVWIHGGGFLGGHSFESIYDGAEFAREGIVVVTVAYRLGVFGFLDVEALLGASYAGSGNNALRDLVRGLEWVKENIAAFGGDPLRVTIGGESAGAKLADILMGLEPGEWGDGGGGVWGGLEGWFRGGGERTADGAGDASDRGADGVYQAMAAALSAAGGDRWGVFAEGAGGDDCCGSDAWEAAADWDESGGECAVYRGEADAGSGGGRCGEYGD